MAGIAPGRVRGAFVTTPPGESLPKEIKACRRSRVERLARSCRLGDNGGMSAETPIPRDRWDTIPPDAQAAVGLDH